MFGKRPGTLTLLLAGAVAACSGAREPVANGEGDVTRPRTCDPLETRDRNSPAQQPAFPQQTRACESVSNVAFEVVVVARGLQSPWAVEPLPGGDLLVTEKPGRMRIVSAAGVVGSPIGGLPAVDARGQGGLLDVALSPGFATDRRIFWSYSEPRQGGNGTSVATGVLSPDRGTLQDVRVLLRVLPTYDGAAHFGSRLAFGPDGMLYVTTGDRSVSSMRRYAQQLDSHLGKVLRIAPDGGVPADNPFRGQPDAQPEVWSVGHRNIQSLAFDPEGRPWIVEHGTQGGDELNRIERGKNYGWPVQAYGEEYSGSSIGGSSTAPAGFEQPVYYWDPVIAPSGAQWYTGDLFPGWRNSLFIGALRDQRLVRLVVENGLVTGEEHLLKERGKRIRDVRQGPDGALYLVTDEAEAELWKLVPRG